MRREIAPRELSVQTSNYLAFAPMARSAVLRVLKWLVDVAPSGGRASALVLELSTSSWAYSYESTYEFLICRRWRAGQGW